MEPLTPQQIEMITHWLNTWEQLKDTAIPIRFKEAFSRQQTKTRKTIGDSVKPPPLGVMPEWIWKEQRQNDLLEAIFRYSEAGIKIPPEWKNELRRLSLKTSP